MVDFNSNAMRVVTTADLTGTTPAHGVFLLDAMIKAFIEANVGEVFGPIASTAPSDTSLIWPDDSTSPLVLKVFDGTDWIAANYADVFGPSYSTPQVRTNAQRKQSRDNTQSAPHHLDTILTDLVVADINEATYWVRGYENVGDGGHGLFTWIAGDQSALVNANSINTLYVPPSSDVTGASGVWKRLISSNDAATPSWRGVVTDGVTDEEEKYRRGVNNGWRRTAILPEGDARLEVAFNFGTIFTDVGSLVKGSGFQSTVLNYDMSTIGGTDILVNVLQDRASFQDFEMSIQNGKAGQNYQMMRLRDGNVSSGMRYTGNATEIAGAQSYVSHVFDFINTFDDFMSFGDTFKDFGRVIIKDNGDASDNSNLKFLFGTSDGCFAEDMAFNTPNGTITDVRVMGMLSRNNQAQTVGGSGHFIGTASGERHIYCANIISGSGDESFHLEEKVRYVAISANVALRDAASAGVSSQDNNVGGTQEWPKYVSVSGNVLANNTQVGSGFILIADGSGGPAGEAFCVTGNVFAGYTNGLRTAEMPARSLLSNNVLTEVDNGIKVRRPSTTINDNLVFDANRILESSASGFIGRVFMENSQGGGIYDGSSVYIPTPTTITAGVRSGFTEWDINIEGMTYAVGGTNYPIIPLGWHMAGRIAVSCFLGGNNYRFGLYDVDWDGTTLNVTTIKDVGVGGSDLVDIRDDGAGNLAVRVNNTTGAAITDKNMQVKFTNGIHIY